MIITEELDIREIMDAIDKWIACDNDEDAQWLCDALWSHSAPELPPAPVYISVYSQTAKSPDEVPDDGFDIIPFENVKFRTRGFRLGDTVTSLIDRNEGNPRICEGATGTVVHLNEIFDTYMPAIGVQWDTDCDNPMWGHFCSGHIDENEPQTGWYVKPETLEVTAKTVRVFETGNISDLFETS